MKNFLQNAAIRAICMLVLGVMLIAYAHEMTRWMVVATGLLFVIPGCISLVSWFMQDATKRSFALYPIVASGCLLFGIVQLSVPDLFTDALRYILSTILLVGAATQCLALWRLHRNGVRKVGGFVLLPIAEFAIALMVMLGTPQTLPLKHAPIFIGCGFVVYALLELVILVLVRRIPKQQMPVTQNNEEIELIEAEEIK